MNINIRRWRSFELQEIFSHRNGACTAVNKISPRNCRRRMRESSRKNTKKRASGATVINSGRNGVGRHSVDRRLYAKRRFPPRWPRQQHGRSAIFLGMVDKDNACTWWNEIVRKLSQMKLWEPYIPPSWLRLIRLCNSGCLWEFEGINIILWEYFKHWVEDWQDLLHE